MTDQRVDGDAETYAAKVKVLRQEGEGAGCGAPGTADGGGSDGRRLTIPAGRPRTVLGRLWVRLRAAWLESNRSWF
jgi:hypothetical protein